MADEPRRETPETPAEPGKAEDRPARGEAADKPDEEATTEVVDDDRFQATDN
jgi:hypothetical protein